MGDQIYVSREQTTDKEHLLSAINAAGKIAPQTVWDILKVDPNPLLKDLLERSGGENINPEEKFSMVLSLCLSEKLSLEKEEILRLYSFFQEFYMVCPHLVTAACSDLTALYNRNPAMHDYGTAFLEFKGYHALQCYRVAHGLWEENRLTAARFFQSLISERWNIDIHPAAVLGERLILDHGTGIVIGETTIVENDVVLFQGITLGGTGKETGKRHPTVRQGSIIGPGSKILGDIEIGQGAKIGSGSVVVKNVSPFTCVFGNPAQVVGQHTHLPGLTFDLSLPPIDYI
ncbi:MULTISPECIES: serine O-acetyltransferase EpsC [Acetobacter]|uniref:Serine acetyltransferase n=2 Tax=Acetobacter TaxID=434 RepID=A0AAN1PGI1_9PROT|nr:MULTISPECIES: serine O-acetyltransferase EpsC [Acetobacter]ASL40882.1 serine O-acetyltransferase [Acetobacter oryzifermentans]AXM99772.1 serine O-acetyltransferase [Acetobacter pomorum]KAA8393393.1 serine O-acetyltransferase [Acetobacter sp. DmW_125124]KAA8396879.1 serine O-acetyltransferase [Acetobacter sp. DmW_125127]KAA8400649.1 serine O-acetyltransferase [Acetobacter sp. DmW_125128]